MISFLLYFCTQFSMFLFCPVLIFTILFQINTLIANGDKNSLRKAVTENMYSVCFTLFYPLFSCFSEILIIMSSVATVQILVISMFWFIIFFPCFQVLKNEIKHRESLWSNVYWELIEPVVKIRTLRARLVSLSLC